MAIKTYSYNPKDKFTQVPRLGILAPGVYEIDDADASELNSRIEGNDGLAFIAVKSAPAPKADKADKADKAGS